MEKIKIADKSIGENQPVFIIAEAGCNHNGNIEIAKKLVDAAIEAGADAIKFQTFKAEDLATEEAKLAEYQEKNTGKRENQVEFQKKLELNEEQHRIIRDYCKEKGVIFSSTPHSSIKDINLLDRLNVPFFKIASGDLTNLPFLDYIARKNKPLLISTGMANLQEIKEAHEVVKSAGNEDIIFLQCTTSYPLEIKYTNLNAINTIRKITNTLIGYSDHTLSIEPSVIAVTLGTCVIEKHFTIDKNMFGPDHKASLEPNELKNFIKSIRLVENKDFTPEEAIKFLNKNEFKLNTNIKEMLGSGIKKPFDFELEIAKIARKSIVASHDIKAGSIIKKEDLAAKRPGTGLSPKYMYGKYNKVIGKKLKINLKKDQQIKLEYLI